VRAGKRRNLLKEGLHPALRATFSREREKGRKAPKINDSLCGGIRSARNWRLACAFAADHPDRVSQWRRDLAPRSAIASILSSVAAPMRNGMARFCLQNYRTENSMRHRRLRCRYVNSILRHEQSQFQSILNCTLEHF